MSREKRLSINFVMGPFGGGGGGGGGIPLPCGAAAILQYAHGLYERGHSVTFSTWPKFLWHHDKPFPGLDPKIPVYYELFAKPEELPTQHLEKSPRN